MDQFSFLASGPFGWEYFRLQRRRLFPELLDWDHWTRLRSWYERCGCPLLGTWSLWPKWYSQLRWFPPRRCNDDWLRPTLLGYQPVRNVAAELSGNCDAQSRPRAGVHRSIADWFSALTSFSQAALRLAVFRLATDWLASLNGFSLPSVGCILQTRAQMCLRREQAFHNLWWLQKRGRIEVEFSDPRGLRKRKSMVARTIPRGLNRAEDAREAKYFRERLGSGWKLPSLPSWGDPWFGKEKNRARWAPGFFCPIPIMELGNFILSGRVESNRTRSTGIKIKWAIFIQ